jgi:N6-L-threonylcarbamoyladenine synthase
MLVEVKQFGEYELLGQTKDDAAGEAFDKVARVLGLGYPGGPAIESASEHGSPHYRLPRAWLKGSDDFSFSGVKTAVVRLAEELGVSTIRHPNSVAADIAASFQQSVVDVLVTKTSAAARSHRVRQVLLAGGVAANGLLRQSMLSRSPVPVLIPEPVLCTDNAAMVASCGYFSMLAGKVDGWDLDVTPGLKLGQ